LEQWSTQIDAIEVPDEVLSTIQLIRAKIDEFNQKPGKKAPPILTYDRRWKKIIRLVRTSAFLNDREKVDLMDCFLMVHCLWDDPSQLEVMQEIVGETIRKHGYSISIKLNSVKKEMDEFEDEVEKEIKVKNITAEEVLKPFEEAFFKLRKNGQPFAGEYIQVKDYNKLRADDMDVINIYDDQFKLVNRLSAEKSDREHQVKVKHNSVLHTFELETYQKEKINYLYKKPHPLVKEFWDKRYDQLNDYLNQQQEKLKTQSPKELEEVDFNLFIDSKLAPIVKSNLEEVVETLESLKLRLEKVRHQYESVE
jgi:MoxR-like ATPase